MSPHVQPLPLSKSGILTASFAVVGALLLILFAVLMGCGGERFTPIPREPPTGVLCECTCQDSPDPAAVPEKNFVAVGSDDATQAVIPGTAALTFSLLELGQNGLAGIRFQSIGVPTFATIIETRIQFTAGATSTAGDVADLQIRVVDQIDALFTAGNPPQPIDLSTLPLLSGAVNWTPGPWTFDDAGAQQLTPDLQPLLQAIVNRSDYTPTSAVAFVIGGFGRRSARSFEGAMSAPAPPFLTIKYEPLKKTKEFAACFNPETEAPAAVCSGRVDDNVTAIATQCNVASVCTCTTKAAPDPTTLADVCNQSCDPASVPDNCNPDGFDAAAQPPSGQTYVCIAESPLRSTLVAQTRGCSLDSDPNAFTVGVR